MRKSMLLVAALSMFVGTGVALAEEQGQKKEGEKMTGVLIDTKCGEGVAKKEGAQAAAAKHPKGCAIKCAEEGGLSLMSGGKLVKLDEASSAKALEYLKGEDHGTRVQVMALKNEDGTLAVAEIKPVKNGEKKAEGRKEESHAEHKH